MHQLKEDWITNGLIDFEYKKYTLLAYLKYVRENFGDRKLYPFLADLVFHYKNLLMIKDSKKFIYENFPRTISRIDFENLRITYKKILKDDDLMREIEDIVEYALEKVGLSLREGRELYDEIENAVEITPVGLSPLQNNEGYLFLSSAQKKDFTVYRYMISIFRNAEETYRGVSTEFIGDYQYSLVNTYEQVKTDLIKTYRQLPNPATYLLRSKIEVPLEETFLPLAKRILVRYVKAA
ncbi:MAG: hypothetical protein JJU28_17860 [Cyclobacteriaceae bacterium]|nr:hypothetical protein [Cyclobacteriaceae bacterium]